MKPFAFRTLLLLSIPAVLAGSRPASAADAASPFTREFSGSLVHWMPWGGEAFARAKQENKPVYLFMGFFLSELSRNTENQSFTNPETAAYLNERFLCILVDRDEHPDIAAAAQQYLDQAKQTSGWPVSLFLTPDMKPYDGASYLSPAQEWGAQSLLQVATRAAEAWKVDSKGCNRTAAGSLAALRRPPPAAKSVDDGKVAAALAAGAKDWAARYDGPHGGFGDAPRYLQPELLAFLLSQGPANRTLALSALRATAGGTCHDSAKGGFYRYLTDTAGNTPYLQKTLVDQARMVLAYAEAQQVAADPVYADAIRGTLAYVLANLQNADGSFASSEDLTGEKPLRDDRAAADANGFLLAALSRAGQVLGDAKYVEGARDLGKTLQLRFTSQSGSVSHFADGSGIASPADYVALALGYRALARTTVEPGAGALADQLLARCDQLFLDAKLGVYLASPAPAPAGVFSRAQTYLLSDNLPAPESVALLAGPSRETAAALKRGLMQRLTVSGSATGDELLALMR